MKLAGVVVKLVITSPCHGEGRGFESRPPRHSFEWLTVRISSSTFLPFQIRAAQHFRK
jgi:hypothetical protein